MMMATQSVRGTFVGFTDVPPFNVFSGILRSDSNMGFVTVSDKFRHFCI